MSVTFYGLKDNDLLPWALDLNVTNANAAVLLVLLGFGDSEETITVLGIEMPKLAEPTGECDISDFIGRIHVALALLDVATDDAHGKPAVADGGPGTGRALAIDCGRRPGYLAEKLAELTIVVLDVASYGEGTVIAWA